MITLFKPNKKKKRKKSFIKAKSKFFIRVLTDCHQFRLHFKIEKTILIRKISVLIKTGYRVAMNGFRLTIWPLRSLSTESSLTPVGFQNSEQIENIKPTTSNYRSVMYMHELFLP